MVLLDGSQPMRYGLKLELDDKYRQLKRALSELCGLESDRMLLVEVYGGVIRVSAASRGVTSEGVCVRGGGGVI